jgi:hypothetical protein
MKIFQAAIEEMAREGAALYGPKSFQGYLRENRLPNVNTWQYVSVDSIDRLDSGLRDAQTMVFRLGSAGGTRETAFGLARLPTGNWSDYFLLDEEGLAGVRPQLYLPDVPSRDLFPFQLLPKLTETSLVNLAFATGLLHRALGLDDTGRGAVPATGQSTFTFLVRPWGDMQEVWTHQRGQVEIDAVFVARRKGTETLFLVEAKSGLPQGSLAKHKLGYPFAALRGAVPAYMQIVPVYMKSWAEPHERHFLISECSIPAEEGLVVSDLHVQDVGHWVLRGFGGVSS